jgi:hypothetical protein
MANKNFFHKGEDILIYASDSGDGVFTTEMASEMIVYRDDVVPSSETAEQLIATTRSVSNDKVLFSIAYTDTYDMEEGPYTAEMRWTDGGGKKHSIIKKSTFTLTNSGMAVLDQAQEG